MGIAKFVNGRLAGRDGFYYWRRVPGYAAALASLALFGSHAGVAPAGAAPSEVSPAKPRVAFSPKFGIMLEKAMPNSPADRRVSAALRGFLFANFDMPLPNHGNGAAPGLRERARAGSTDAMVAIGGIYYAKGIAATVSGHKGSADFRKARAWLLKAYAHGSERAGVLLGSFYLQGIGARRDYRRASVYLHRAAAGGNARAMALLALAYYLIGGGKSVARGNYWLNNAIAGGSLSAMLLAGVGNLPGVGKHPAPKTAVSLFHTASSKGCAAGAFDLGLCYERGIGVPKSNRTARKLFRRAARKGIPAAMCALGIMYQNGVGGPVDLAGALHWFKRAALLGYPSGMDDLAVLYFHGLGTTKDLGKSFRLFRQAAHAGSRVAMVNLADDYSWGYGTPKNEKKYVKWLKRAASAGQATAMWQLALVYLSGPKAEITSKKGVGLIRSAAKLDQPQALRALGSLYFYGEGGVDQDFAKSLHYYRRAAEKGSVLSMLNIGFMYLRGQGVPASARRALKWFRRAQTPVRSLAANGSPSAARLEKTLDAGLKDAKAALHPEGK